MKLDSESIINEAIRINKAYAYDILAAQNIKLLESHKQLLEALEHITRIAIREYGMNPNGNLSVKKAQAAINNAKTIL